VAMTRVGHLKPIDHQGPTSPAHDWISGGIIRHYAGMSVRVLILGGSWFVGREVAIQAVERGWDVTVFHRGRSQPPAGVQAIHGDRESTEDLRRLADAGPWDAVVDVAGSVPSVVRDSARALVGAVGRYAFVSTVSTYARWPHDPVSEDSPLHPADPDWGPDAADYGPLKVGCEAAIAREYKPDRMLIVRPGVILGPHEYVGRLQWWLNRCRRGGRILAPGSPDRAIQPVDVRDVAQFLLDQIAAAGYGLFNIAAPPDRDTYSGLLEACLDVTDGAGELVWVDEQWLAEQDVRQWTELPLWRVPRGTWAMDTSRARAAGLRCRPLRDTVADTWAWLNGGGKAVDHERQAEHGIDAGKERDLLAAAAAAAAIPGSAPQGG
jgi:2'-hydroxyisoflavone reductase